MKISAIKARQILDSRGNPTVQVDVQVAGAWHSASVPSGASTGTHEAVELRDGGKAFHGKGVQKALSNIAALSQKIQKSEFADQAAFDAFLLKEDGTPDKSKFGANALLALSMAFARGHAGTKPLYVDLASSLRRTPALPLPFANVLNGGKHAGTPLKIQEFMVVPVGAKTFADATQMVAETYQSLKKNAVKKFGPAAGNVGDEGGIAPPLQNTRDALDLIQAAIEENGHQKNVALALDAAASEFYDAKTKTYAVDGRALSASALAQFYLDLQAEYGLVSIEDPFHEESFSDFAELTQKLKGKSQVVGDDLLVTNPARIETGKQSCSALLLKLNQIGTLSESIAAAKIAESFGWNVMVSHRSGETGDAFISDLATALSCGQIKLGAPCRGERTAKYNRLLRVEEDGVPLARFRLP
ncbi:MAG: phosphopyruvate hydratase [Candidatus Micrarchaeota archaeon]|nr:phosphopyruvate hydratase [Candidatus Micrarchaeota archaeon]